MAGNRIFCGSNDLVVGFEKVDDREIDIYVADPYDSSVFVPHAGLLIKEQDTFNAVWDALQNENQTIKSYSNFVGFMQRHDFHGDEPKNIYWLGLEQEKADHSLDISVSEFAASSLNVGKLYYNANPEFNDFLNLNLDTPFDLEIGDKEFNNIDKRSWDGKCFTKYDGCCSCHIAPVLDMHGGKSNDYHSNGSLESDYDIGNLVGFVDDNKPVEINAVTKEMVLDAKDCLLEKLGFDHEKDIESWDLAAERVYNKKDKFGRLVCVFNDGAGVFGDYVPHEAGILVCSGEIALGEKEVNRLIDQGGKYHGLSKAEANIISQNVCDERLMDHLKDDLGYGIDNGEVKLPRGINKNEFITHFECKYGEKLCADDISYDTAIKCTQEDFEKIEKAAYDNER